LAAISLHVDVVLRGGSIVELLGIIIGDKFVLCILDSVHVDDGFPAFLAVDLMFDVLDVATVEHKPVVEVDLLLLLQCEQHFFVEKLHHEVRLLHCLEFLVEFVFVDHNLEYFLEVFLVFEVEVVIGGVVGLEGE